MKEKKSAALFQLFYTFFKIGAFTFGGGYAMIPLIQRDAVENHKWISDSEMLDMLAIAESTPGPIAINSATFIGYKVAGVAGSAMATLGVVLPSFVIISLISLILEPFKQLVYVQYAFQGIRAGVVVLILNAIIKLFKSCKHDLFSIFLMLFAFCMVALLHFDAIYTLIIAAVAGILYTILRPVKGGDTE